MSVSTFKTQQKIPRKITYSRKNNAKIVAFLNPLPDVSGSLKRVNMLHSFALFSPDNTHLGFWLMLTNEDHSESGQFALKLNEAGEHFAVLRALQEDEHALFWQVQADRVVLFDHNHLILGNIKQEWLHLSGQTFLLTDLTGNK